LPAASPVAWFAHRHGETGNPAGTPEAYPFLRRTWQTPNAMTGSASPCCAPRKRVRTWSEVVRDSPQISPRTSPHASPNLCMTHFRC